MPSTTIRISPTSQDILRELSVRSGRTMQAVLEEAIELYRRERFLAKANEAYAALRRDTKKWKAELAERAAWDATAADALKDD